MFRPVFRPIYEKRYVLKLLPVSESQIFKSHSCAVYDYTFSATMFNFLHIFKFKNYS